MKALIIAVLLPLAGVAAAAPELKHERVEISFVLPDGSIQSATLLDDEVRLLIGEDGAYQVDWWIRGGERKLDIPTLLATIPGGSKAKAAVAIAEPSPVAESTGTLQPSLERHIPRISVGYERFPQQ